MSYIKGLRCRECGREYPAEPLYVCEYCFGPLEVAYDYHKIGTVLSREILSRRPDNMWRYRELLPLNDEPSSGLNSGFTPLVHATELARALGVEELYIKDDSVCHPTFSFKDRVVATAISKAKEFGFDTVACASTGNLANSVAAQAARAGLKRYIFIPADLEQGKVVASQIYAPNLVAVDGTYDDVNRLCSEIGARYQWAFVNINIRPYYAEGSKTYGHEIAEQLGWRAPQHIIVPCAGGSLICKIYKAFQEFYKLGLIDDVPTKVYAAQASGCAPIVNMITSGSDVLVPCKPNTIAKSIAIGNPADGYYARETAINSGGWGATATDEEIVEGIQLLARTEGIFTETAGGVTVAAAKKLIESGRIPRDESIVISITGNGLKTLEAVARHLPPPVTIKASMRAFEECGVLPRDL
ncbi:MAG TPA: threonine synthase [Armatimonadota bacterium]|nr:threonine synthase [Armatimonadota bacterium]